MIFRKFCSTFFYVFQLSEFLTYPSDKINFLSEGVRIRDALYMNPALCPHYSVVIMAIVGVGCSFKKNCES